MRLDPIVLAVPMYFVFMGLEAWIDHRRRAGRYRLYDTFSNLACGVFQQALVVVLMGVLGAPYRWLYEHARFTDWFAAHPTVAWWIAFVGSDFFYYWFHRWSHEAAIGWFSHVVHHQSEEYNLSVALRQDAWQPLFSLWFQLPLALLGVPPAAFVSAYGLMIVYQFWIHTRFIGRIGPLEWVLNTPSHHRVHHGVNPRYLDKNYAGVFIIWDRMFGTFEPEVDAPTYGIIEALQSFNPVWAHFQYGVKLWKRMGAVDGLWNKFQVLVRNPGWQAPGAPEGDLMAAAAARVGAEPYDVVTSASMRAYLTACFAFGMALSLVVLGPVESRGVRVLATALCVWVFGNVGGLAEARWWAPLSQRVMLGTMAVLGLALAVFAHPAWIAMSVTALALAWWQGRA